MLHCVRVRQNPKICNIHETNMNVSLEKSPKNIFLCIILTNINYDGLINDFTLHSLLIQARILHL